MSNPKFGDGKVFESPKSGAVSNEIREMQANYQKRLDFEKYMNPKGLKPTITSNFVKPQREIDFVNHEVKLMRSPKTLGKDFVSFRVSPFLSKPEIQ